MKCLHGVTSCSICGTGVGGAIGGLQQSYPGIWQWTQSPTPGATEIIAGLRKMIDAQISKENYKVAADLAEALETIANWRSVL